MVKGKWFPQGSDISLPLMLREKVFSVGRDELDDQAQQVVVFDGDAPVGAARLWWAEGAFHIGFVGVAAEARGKGFGDLLMRLLLFKATQHHAARIALLAAPETEAFFGRYGFAAQGEAAGGRVPMSLGGQDVCLSHCQGRCNGCG